jgi:hypothetical protein
MSTFVCTVGLIVCVDVGAMYRERRHRSPSSVTVVGHRHRSSSVVTVVGCVHWSSSVVTFAAHVAFFAHVTIDRVQWFCRSISDLDTGSNHNLKPSSLSLPSTMSVSSPLPTVTKAKAPPKADCSICASSVRGDAIKCSSCTFECCSGCVKKFLLSLPDTCATAHCMECKANWDLLIERALSPTFLNGDWRKKRARFLLVQEKSMLEEAQAQVVQEERMKKAKEFRKEAALKAEEHEYYRAEYSKKSADYRELSHAVRNGDPSEHIYDRLFASIPPFVKIDKKKAEAQVEAIPEAAVPSPIASASPAAASSSSTKQQKRGPCPAKDCRGILNSEWKCGLCSTQVCPQCRELKSEDSVHKCDPETVKSVELMSKESRPCPSCGVGIERTEGCSHMFCTSCKTGFDWNTMKKIADGRNTNPYLAEYKRMGQTRNSPASAAATVGACLTERTIYTILENSNRQINTVELHYLLIKICKDDPDTPANAELTEKTTKAISAYRDIRSNLRHIAVTHYPSLDPYRRSRGDTSTMEEKTETYMKSQRVDYLMKKITEEQWLENIGRRDQLYRREKTVKDILDLWTSGSAEILNEPNLAALGSELATLIAALTPPFYSWSKRAPAGAILPSDRKLLDRITARLQEVTTQLTTLRTYCVGELKAASARYSCKVPSDLSAHNYSTRYNLKGEALHQEGTDDGLTPRPRKAKKKEAKVEEEEAPVMMDLVTEEDDAKEVAAESRKRKRQAEDEKEEEKEEDEKQEEKKQKTEAE